MFVLHVDIELKAAAGQDLEKTYREIFRPAISRQEGFGGVSLLRPVEPGGGYVLSIAFENRGLQERWVATELHQRVWPQMESHCAKYSVQYYEQV